MRLRREQRPMTGPAGLTREAALRIHQTNADPIAVVAAAMRIVIGSLWSSQPTRAIAVAQDVGRDDPRLIMMLGP